MTTQLLSNVMRRIVRGSDCWTWSGAHTDSGYGVMKVRGNCTARAHRLVFEIFVGPVPGGLVLDHLCRNRGCVNPAHLEPVTREENIRRGPECARRRSATHCPKGHPYSGSNLYVYPDGRRACKECVRHHGKRYREKRKTKPAC